MASRWRRPGAALVLLAGGASVALLVRRRRHPAPLAEPLPERTELTDLLERAAAPHVVVEPEPEPVFAPEPEPEPVLEVPQVEEPESRVQPEPEPAPEPEPEPERYRPPARRREETPKLLQATAEGPINPEGVAVRCLTCRSVQRVMLDASGYTCRECQAQWQWAICGNCDHLGIARESQPSWRCSECGHYTRSWWQAADFWRDIERIVERRHLEEIEAERRRRRARLRAKRAGIVMGILAVIGLIAAGVVVKMAARNDPAAKANVACKHFDRVESEDTNGTINRAQLRAELSAVVDETDGAPPDIQAAAAKVQLAASEGTASTGYLAARTAMHEACAAITG